MAEFIFFLKTRTITQPHPVLQHHGQLNLQGRPGALSTKKGLAALHLASVSWGKVRTAKAALAVVHLREVSHLLSYRSGRQQNEYLNPCLYYSIGSTLSH